MKAKRIAVTHKDMIKLLGMPNDSFILDASICTEIGALVFTIGNNRFPEKKPFEAIENIMFEPKKES